MITHVEKEKRDELLTLNYSFVRLKYDNIKKKTKENHFFDLVFSQNANQL